MVDSITSPNDRGAQIVHRFLLMKFFKDVALDEVIATEAREIIQNNVQKARWYEPIEIDTGRSFAEERMIGVSVFEPYELQLIRNAGFQVAPRTMFQEYDSALIHGARYNAFDLVERGYCNYFVYITSGFYICRKIISFNDVKGENISGIIGSRLKTRNPLFGTSYIRPYTPEENQSFVSYLNIISPAISMNWENQVVIIPLANNWESD